MANVLVSWIAYSNDFIREDGAFKEVCLTGPTYQFHKYFYKAGKYDRHILLYSDASQELYAAHLKTRIFKDFSHVIEERLLPIKEVIDLPEIKTKVESFLLDFASDTIDIFFSPGTSVMQLSWYLCHQSLGLRTRLIQTKSGKFTASGQPELMEIEVSQSETPYTAVLKENRLSATMATKDLDYMITPSIKGVYDRAFLVAQTDKVTTIIRGESGTGKEHLARFIHKESIRKNEPFIAVNCAALTEELLESRLFGFKKGAFTGANQDTEGLFAQAKGGTIFLDEIGDISPRMQMALLRVMQEREIQPIGGKPKQVDVRIIAATNAPLEDRCKSGDFRWDLYYRLCVAELELPSLAERGKAELEALMTFFVEKKQRELLKAKPLNFLKEAKKLILDYSFPGNIRELENLIESLYVFCPVEVRVENIPKRLRQANALDSLRLSDIVQAHVQKVLALKNGNKRQTALTLGITENTLSKKLSSKESEE